MNKDLISGVVLLAIAGTYYTWSTQIADSTLSDEVGAGGLPQVLSVILAILAVILIARALLVARLRTAAAAGSDDEDDNARLPRAIGFLLFGAAYIFLLPFVGYIIATALMIGAVALYEGAPRTWVVVAAAIGGGVFYWAVFVKLLGVHQPMGLIFQGLF
ncbi:tripartite tricarboxylate transporter TctB family protein [Rhizobium sp. P32RR-XVIII]|uniref:tripartite tricarboxylate transporter TctB family protein n=1 Tax=Rhizobium sp. P32RR-XVIII TaxID=2726738 RepID=UPI00145654FF|nr:tripartite tricarboxylate transporter TctB family protein [Rhizobium sp. P32RR-XVIII]NLS04113.1 tripartite tricarboxylate transporter TctB family protein [Rhizobium sp. P32RR-XVIII]